MVAVLGSQAAEAIEEAGFQVRVELQAFPQNDFDLGAVNDTADLAAVLQGDAELLVSFPELPLPAYRRPVSFPGPPQAPQDTPTRPYAGPSFALGSPVGEASPPRAAPVPAAPEPPPRQPYSWSLARDGPGGRREDYEDALTDVRAAIAFLQADSSRPASLRRFHYAERGVERVTAEAYRRLEYSQAALWQVSGNEPVPQAAGDRLLNLVISLIARRQARRRRSSGPGA